MRGRCGPALTAGASELRRFAARAGPKARLGLAGFPDEEEERTSERCTILQRYPSPAPSPKEVT